MTEDKKRELLGAELALVQECLGQNPKIYCVWYHRKWCFKQGVLGPEDLQRDLKLCAKLLQLDDRNFHCWGYRNLFLAELAGLPAAEEVAFTTTKINANFSNYSAWHYRSKLLPHLPQGETEPETKSDTERGTCFL